MHFNYSQIRNSGFGRYRSNGVAEYWSDGNKTNILLHQAPALGLLWIGRLRFFIRLRLLSRFCHQRQFITIEDFVDIEQNFYTAFHFSHAQDKLGI